MPRKQGEERDADGVDAEDEAEALHGKAVDLLEDEGRGGNVREETAHGKSLLTAVAEEGGLPEEASRVFEGSCHASGHAISGGQRFRQDKEAAYREKDANGSEEPEYGTPARGAGHEAADDRTENGTHAVDGHEERHEAGERRALIRVAADGPREDNASGAAEAHAEAEGQKGIAVLHDGAEP